MPHLIKKILGFLFILISAATLALASAPAKKPNIIFIYADDLGYGDLSSYGQTKFSTPNIDRLAAEGIRFTQHYSGCTVCAPARASLLTGLHTGHAPVRGNAEIYPEGQSPIPARYTTVAEVLRDSGYSTAAFGKWGLGFINTEGDPRAQGFQKFFGYNCQRWAHRYYPPYLWDNDKQVFLRGNDMQSTTTYSPDVIHAETLAYIRAQKDNPFFLFVASPLPHAEMLVPDDEIFAQFKGKFPEIPFTPSVSEVPGFGPVVGAYGPNASPIGYCPQPAPRATFAAMVTRLDKQVGEIVALVKELGLSDNTLIVFSSDNGPHKEGGHTPAFFNSNGGLRGTKRDLYEGGIRTPLIAYWPGKIPAGKTTDQICAGWDFLPTFAEIAKAPVPSGLDGLSFAPTLLNRPADQKQHGHLYWEFGEAGGAQAVRQGNWKGVRLYGPDKKPRFELYDLSSDLKESKNLAAQHPDVAARLEKLIDQSHVPHPTFKLPHEEK